MDVNENQVPTEKGKEASSSRLDVSDDESELPWAMYRSLDPAYKNEAKESEDWLLDDEEDITGNTSCCDFVMQCLVIMSMTKIRSK